MKSLVGILTIILSFFFPAAISAEDFIVVIDAGHGGKDYGAIGTKAREKDINLGVALKLGKLIEDNCDDVKVVYTRDDDTFIPLQTRADIANKASGDLFISIHTNSVDKKSKNYKTVSGASVYTLGFRRSEENLAVALRENSVIKLESDYSTVYEGFDPSSTESYIIFEMSRDKHMEQSIEAASAVQKELVGSAGRLDRGVRQANFWVLFKTSMPAMLVELDFICNPNCESFMNSEKGQTKLANAIYNGFKSYKKSDDLRKASLNGNTLTENSSSNNKQTSSPKKQKASAKSETQQLQPREETHSSTSSPVNESGLIYKIQIFTSSSAVTPSSSKFKGLKDTDYYKDNGLYKYTTGRFSTIEDANKKLVDIRKLFPDAFVITFSDGKRIK